MWNLNLMVTLRFIWPLAAWAAALYGVLQIRHLTGAWDHVVCGPWGCGPPLSSLVAYHGFWFVLLGGGALLAAKTWSRRALRNVGFGLILGSVVALLALVGWDLVSWLPLVADTPDKHLLQRALFVVLTSVDVPATAIGLTGVICLVASRRQTR